MKMEVEHMGDLQFSVATRGHEIYCDQPEANGGYDEAMTPPEMFLGALGACAAFYAVDHLKRKKLAFEGTRVQASAEKLKNPTRLGEIVLHVTAPQKLNTEEQEELLRSVEKCILHNTLTHPPEIRTEIDAGPVEEASEAELVAA